MKVEFVTQPPHEITSPEYDMDVVPRVGEKVQLLAKSNGTGDEFKYYFNVVAVGYVLVEDDDKEFKAIVAVRI